MEKVFGRIRKVSKESHKKEVGQHSLENVCEDHQKAMHRSLVSWRSRREKGSEEVELREGEEVAGGIDEDGEDVPVGGGTQDHDTVGVVDHMPPFHGGPHSLLRLRYKSSCVKRIYHPILSNQRNQMQ